MSLCNIIKLENRMYKLIPQPAAQARPGTEEEEVLPGGWTQPARRTGIPRQRPRIAPTNATWLTGMCTPRHGRTTSLP